jgi:hypothetical protein
LRRFASCLLLLIPIAASAQITPDATILSLIEKLGSKDFKVRIAATAALKERPDALPALQSALTSTDRELAQRVAEIIDFFKRKPVRDLELAVNNGQVEHFVNHMLDWPDGMYENEAWFQVCELANKLRNLHEKDGGEKLWLSTERITQHLDGRPIPHRIREKRITGLASGFKDHEIKSRGVYLCADEVELNGRRGENLPKSIGWAYNVFAGAIIAKRSVFAEFGDTDPVIFCANRVELSGGGYFVLVVSAGDVILNANGLRNSLVIAKGNIIVKNHRIERSRLIAGKKVITDDADDDLDKSVLISQNDLNPLGFIRWADSPKEKATPR